MEQRPIPDEGEPRSTIMGDEESHRTSTHPNEQLEDVTRTTAAARVGGGAEGGAAQSHYPIISPNSTFLLHPHPSPAIVHQPPPHPQVHPRSILLSATCLPTKRRLFATTSSALPPAAAASLPFQPRQGSSGELVSSDSPASSGTNSSSASTHSAATGSHDLTSPVTRLRGTGQEAGLMRRRQQRRGRIRGSFGTFEDSLQQPTSPPSSSDEPSPMNEIYDEYHDLTGGIEPEGDVSETTAQPASNTLDGTEIHATYISRLFDCASIKIQRIGELLFSFSMSFSVIFALFGESIRLGYAPRSMDGVFLICNILVFALFFVEAIIYWSFSHLFPTHPSSASSSPVPSTPSSTSSVTPKNIVVAPTTFAEMNEEEAHKQERERSTIYAILSFSSTMFSVALTHIRKIQAWLPNSWCLEVLLDYFSILSLIPDILFISHLITLSRLQRDFLLILKGGFLIRLIALIRCIPIDLGQVRLNVMDRHWWQSELLKQSKFIHELIQALSSWEKMKELLKKQFSSTSEQQKEITRTMPPPTPPSTNVDPFPLSPTSTSPSTSAAISTTPASHSSSSLSSQRSSSGSSSSAGGVSSSPPFSLDMKSGTPPILTALQSRAFQRIGQPRIETTPSADTIALETMPSTSSMPTPASLVRHPSSHSRENVVSSTTPPTLSGSLLPSPPFSPPLPLLGLQTGLTSNQLAHHRSPWLLHRQFSHDAHHPPNSMAPSPAGSPPPSMAMGSANRLISLSAMSPMTHGRSLMGIGGGGSAVSSPKSLDITPLTSPRGGDSSSHSLIPFGSSSRTSSGSSTAAMTGSGGDGDSPLLSVATSVQPSSRVIHLPALSPLISRESLLARQLHPQPTGGGAQFGSSFSSTSSASSSSTASSTRSWPKNLSPSLLPSATPLGNQMSPLSRVRGLSHPPPSLFIQTAKKSSPKMSSRARLSSFPRADSAGDEQPAAVRRDFQLRSNLSPPFLSQPNSGSTPVMEPPTVTRSACTSPVLRSRRQSIFLEPPPSCESSPINNEPKETTTSGESLPSYLSPSIAMDQYQMQEEEELPTLPFSPAPTTPPMAQFSHASHIGQLLSDYTAHRVIIGLLLVLFVWHLTHPLQIDHRPRFGLERIQAEFIRHHPYGDHSLPWSKRVLMKVDSQDLRQVFPLQLANLIEKYERTWSPQLLFLRVGSYVLLNQTSLITSFRPEEMYKFHTADCETILDIHSYSQLNARFDFYTMVWLILMLPILLFVIYQDVHAVVSPIERMVSFVTNLARDPLNQFGSQETTTTALTTVAVDPTRIVDVTNEMSVLALDSGRDELSLNSLARNATHRTSSNLSPDSEHPPMASSFVEVTLQKLASLLQVGFGSAGGEIIAQNIIGDYLDPMIPGSRVYAIFGFCDILNFNKCTESLEESILLFVNQIAAIVHDSCQHFGGSVNKNIGSSFLLVWKFDPEDMKALKAAVRTQRRRGGVGSAPGSRLVTPIPARLTSGDESIPSLSLSRSSSRRSTISDAISDAPSDYHVRHRRPSIHRRSSRATTQDRDRPRNNVTKDSPPQATADASSSQTTSEPSAISNELTVTPSVPTSMTFDSAASSLPPLTIETLQLHDALTSADERLNKIEPSGIPPRSTTTRSVARRLSLPGGTDSPMTSGMVSPLILESDLLSRPNLSRSSSATRGWDLMIRTNDLKPPATGVETMDHGEPHMDTASRYAALVTPIGEGELLMLPSVDQHPQELISPTAATRSTMTTEPASTISTPLLVSNPASNLSSTWSSAVVSPASTSPNTNFNFTENNSQASTAMSRLLKFDAYSMRSSDRPIESTLKIHPIRMPFLQSRRKSQVGFVPSPSVIDENEPPPSSSPSGSPDPGASPMMMKDQPSRPSPSPDEPAVQVVQKAPIVEEPVEELPRLQPALLSPTALVRANPQAQYQHPPISSSTPISTITPVKPPSKQTRIPPSTAHTPASHSTVSTVRTAGGGVAGGGRLRQHQSDASRTATKPPKSTSKPRSDSVTSATSSTSIATSASTSRHSPPSPPIRTTVHRIAQQALSAFLSTIIQVATAASMTRWKTDARLQAKMPTGYEGPEMGFGLHVGWAIEGAIGSSHKIDASYLSPNVNLAARLCSATRQYKIPLLFSGPFYKLLDVNIQKRCRHLDQVMLKGSAQPLDLYTFDISPGWKKVALASSTSTTATTSTSSSTASTAASSTLPTTNPSSAATTSSQSTSPPLPPPRDYSTLRADWLHQVASINFRLPPRRSSATLNTEQAAAAASAEYEAQNNSNNTSNKINETNTANAVSGSLRNNSLSRSSTPLVHSTPIPPPATPVISSIASRSELSSHDSANANIITQLNILLSQLQCDLPDGYIDTFNRGIKYYLSGDWEMAGKFLIKFQTIHRERMLAASATTTPLDGDGSTSTAPTSSSLIDGPSSLILQFMGRYAFQAPKDWAGYRKLEKK